MAPCAHSPFAGSGPTSAATAAFPSTCHEASTVGCAAPAATAGPDAPAKELASNTGVRAKKTSTVADADASYGQGSASPVGDSAFFTKYTYSGECALLAQNFHNSLCRTRLLERIPYGHDPRLISVTLVYVFYKFQCHHCDMALDLSLALAYVEDLVEMGPIDLGANADGLNVTVALVFLAHSHNADRAIRLKDWFREVFWRSFGNVRDVNAFVFRIFSKVLQLQTRRRDTRVKRHVQRLCSVPSAGVPSSGAAAQPQPQLQPQPEVAAGQPAAAVQGKKEKCRVTSL